MVAGFNAVCEMSWAPWNYTLLGFRLMWPSRSIGVIRGEPLLHASWKLASAKLELLSLRDVP